MRKKIYILEIYKQEAVRERLFGFAMRLSENALFPKPALCSKNYPRNINQMPAVIFFACLDLEQKSLFLDGHSLTGIQKICGQSR